MMLAERLPPHDIEAEESVLGALLIDGSRTVEVVNVVKPDDFYRERNRWVYEACVSLYQKGEPVDTVTIAHALDAAEKLADVGGAAYLAHLSAVVPTSTHAVYYGKIVHDTAEQRRCIAFGTDLMVRAYKREAPEELAQALVTEGLAILKARARRGRLQPVKDATAEHFNTIWEDYHSGFKARGIKTGIEYVDRQTGGLEPGKLYVVGARTSVGKTMFLITIAGNAAQRGIPTAYFSAEQTARSILTRLITAQLGMDVRHMTPEQRDEQQDNFVDAFGRVGDLPLWITDGSALTTSDIHSDALRVAARNPLGLILVDFLGALGDTPWNRTENTVHLLGRMTTALKHTAMELSVPIVVAVQLNRASEQRVSKRPELRDLRDSGEIEQVADVVMLLYRDSYYKKEAPDTLEVNVAKNRDGPTGRADIYYDPRTGRIGNLARPEQTKTGNAFFDGVN